MSRTISYRGPAAGAFLKAQRAEKLVTEDEKFERVATIVYGQVSAGTKEGMQTAISILRLLLKQGINKLSSSLVGDEPSAPKTRKNHKDSHGSQTPAVDK